MMRIILDPRVLTFVESCADEKSLVELWTLVVEWAGDQRVGIGSHSFQYIWEQLQHRGYPDKDLAMHPPGMRSTYRTALNMLTSRVLECDESTEDRKVTPDYLGKEGERVALIRDSVSSAPGNVIGIASVNDSWAASAEFVAFDPSPPQPLALCLQPGIELAEEQNELVRSRLQDYRLHIVGAKKMNRLVEQISEKTGIPVQSISWIESEKSQKPRNLDSRWSGLMTGRDITVCITGRIGHPSSIKAQKIAKNAGVPYLPIDNVNDIAKEVALYAVKYLSS